MSIPTPLIRWWAKVGDETDSGCWPWIGAKNSKGYGQIRIANRAIYAHRFAYEQYVGPIGDGLQIDHLCGNRACVNPAHLEAVTPRVNVLRGDTISARNAAKTHCVNGHPFTPEHTYYRRNGWRMCRTCVRERRMKAGA